MKRVMWLSAVLSAVAMLPLSAQVIGSPAVKTSALGLNYDWPDHVVLGTKPDNNQFGMEWAGPVTIHSIEIQLKQDSVYRDKSPNTVYAYYGPGPNDYVPFTLAPGYDKQTITFNTPIAATHSYLMLVVKDLHGGVTLKTGDFFLLDTFTIDARVAGANDVNLNRSPGTTFSVQTDQTVWGGAPVNDGNIATKGDHWSRATDSTITATYTAPQTVGSIGLGFYADNGDNKGAVPMTLLVSAYDEENELITSKVIAMTPYHAQYARYDLDDSFVGVKSLSVTAFANGEWMPNSGEFFGYTEFQAFATRLPAVVPEPATMTLLTLGGLAILRRRTNKSQ